MGRAKTALGGALTSLVKVARARPFPQLPQLSGPARCCSRRSAAAATLSATGSASPRPDRTSWLGGLRRAFSPAFRAGSLYPLARGCRRNLARRKMAYAAQLLNNALTECLKRGRVNLLSHGRARASFSATSATLRAGAMLLEAIGPPGRCSGCGRRPRRSQLRGQLRHDPIAAAG